MFPDVTVSVEPSEHGPVLVKTASSATGEARLVGEATRLERARHPGVVEILSHEPRRLDLAWAGSQTLATLGVPFPTAAAILASVSSTVADLHDIGLVHGTLDPSHVVIGADGRPRICGLGGPHRSPDAAGPADDVAQVGHLIDQLVGSAAEIEPIPKRRLARRHWTGYQRRALQTLADQATHEDPARRPTARALAAAIADSVPDAHLAPLSAEPDPSLALQRPEPRRPRTTDDATATDDTTGADDGSAPNGMARDLGRDPAGDREDSSEPDEQPSLADEPSGPETELQDETREHLDEGRRGPGDARVDDFDTPIHTIGATDLTSSVDHLGDRPDDQEITGSDDPAARTLPLSSGIDHTDTDSDSDLPGTVAHHQVPRADRDHGAGGPHPQDDIPGDRDLHGDDRAGPAEAGASTAGGGPADHSGGLRRAPDGEAPDAGGVLLGMRVASTETDQEDGPGPDAGRPQVDPEQDRGHRLARPHPETGPGRRSGPTLGFGRDGRRRQIPLVVLAAAAAIALLGGLAATIDARRPSAGTAEVSTAAPTAPGASDQTAGAEQPERSDVPGPRDRTAEAPIVPANDTRLGCAMVSGPVADPDHDGCPEAVTVDGSTVTVGNQEYAVGEAGDEVTVGDWNCDGTVTPALVRPTTGEVFVFDQWASPTGDMTVHPVAVVPGARSLEPATGEGCRARVLTEDHQARTLELPGAGS